MANHLIVAQSEVTASALGEWLELAGGTALHKEGSKITDPRCLVFDHVDLSHRAMPGAFRCVASWLETNCTQAASQSEIPSVLVDSVAPESLCAIHEGGWNTLIALLILAFPEVRWVFGVSTGQKPSWWENRLGLPTLFYPEFDPLFDGTGLRAWVRENTAEHPGEDRRPVAPWIPLRKEWSVAIDDESIYAYLHAYTAYRHGFRSFAIHTEALADHLLKKGWLGRPYVTLEDIYLGFPDKNPRAHYANLKKRDGLWPMLALESSDPPRRYFITSGHEGSDDDNTLWVNQEHQERLAVKGRGGLQINKPTSGLFSLWRDLDLTRSLVSWDTKTDEIYSGLAPGFYWPPAPKSPEDYPPDGEGGHSAPGLLLMVAERLIHRAGVLFDEVANVKMAVRGAVLATSSLELLGPKTPTTARDSLELKHRFEVLAECQFGGIQRTLRPKHRMREIQRELRLLGSWYGVSARDSAVLNGELMIVSQIMGIYREHNEFDEEELCRSRVRTLHRKIWFLKGWTNPITWVLWPIRAYIEYLLGSLTRFAIALPLWVGGLSLTFYALKCHLVATEQSQRTCEISATPAEGLQTLGQALSSFFGAEPLAHGNGLWVGLTIVAMVSGFMHLGIFVSQLYSLVSRK